MTNGNLTQRISLLIMMAVCGMMAAMAAAGRHMHILGSAILFLFICDVRSFQHITAVSSYRQRYTSSVGVLYTSKTSDHNAPQQTKKQNDIHKSSKIKRNKRQGKRRRQLEEITNPSALETWRVYGIDVKPDDMNTSTNNKQKVKEDDCIPPERSYLTYPVLSSLLSRLRIESDIYQSGREEEEGSDTTTIPIQLPHQLKDAWVVRRSIDARRRRGADPKYTYVIDITLTREVAMRELMLSHQPGRMERIGTDKKKPSGTQNMIINDTENSALKSKPKIIIVGAGPAGLFCALSLASSGLFTPILLERGLPVEGRGKSIGALINRRSLDPESNFSFGEGGAGTWSDGKLTTRIGRNSEAVRFVLETLVKYGAPKHILVEGAPHLGTDNLVRLLRNMRADLRSLGGEIHFGACVNKFHIEEGTIKGVDAKCIPITERSIGKTNSKEDDIPFATTQSFHGDAVVLATGHSARDVYYELHKSGVDLESKGFAVGFRIEHPQRIINEIQYGKDWGGRVITHRLSTDAINNEHFAKGDTDNDKSVSHTGRLPVASYRLATNEAFDGKFNRGAYSFCMCPGGQIVPSSTEEGELCINGMSFSKRDSVFANSAMVVTVDPDDKILEQYRKNHGSLAGLEFQREIERKAFELGGGDMRAPVQRLTDFVDQRISESVPPSSYRLGVKPAELHDIYPEPIYNALVHAIVNNFEKQMPGFLCHDAILHGVETRTSSPVRVLRDKETLQASGVDNLFPSGEGAGFAGGIVSAAVDGLMVANSIKTKFAVSEDESTSFFSGKAVGVEY